MNKLKVTTFHDLKVRLKHYYNYQKWSLLLILLMITQAIAISSLSPPKSTKINYQFPSPPLDQNFTSLANSLKFISSHNFTTSPQISHVIATQRYIYESNQGQLQIDAIYLNRGIDVARELKPLNINYDPQSLQPKYSSTSGHYITFTADNRAYLAACINPRGKATITSQEFIANRNRYDTSSDRLALYLLGRGDLRDNRCLLSIISIPKQKSDPAQYQLLENIWHLWYEYWQYHFPQ
ncbi:MAG: cyanoexosortase A system-associated protein [Pseudanabaenaceae cyanobacterium bins.39]|nr:cyanoexosortase A system-associated protein [Pseudanabaenaceae cyanobacterium bins.39]